MHSVFVVAFATTLFLSTSLAQGSAAVCNAATFGNANATVSNSNIVPALHPQDPINGSLYGEYTFSTAVREVVDDTNASSVLQGFWLRSSKPVSTPPLQLPFAGCAFFLLASQDSSLVGADLDNVGCSKALPDGCEDALIDALRTNVTILSEEALSDNTSTCSSLTEVLQTPPPECKGAVWDEVVAIQPFGNPDFQTLGSSCNDSAINVFDGSASGNMLYDLSYPSTPNGNDTYYEMALKTSVPIFLAAWPRGNVTFSWIADVRSLCLTSAAGVKAGSETATSGAVNARSGMGLLSMTCAFVMMLTFGFLF